MPYHGGVRRDDMVKWVLVGSFVLKKVYDMVVRHLDDVQNAKELPANVRDVYSEQEYEKYQAYRKDRRGMSFAQSMILAVLFLAFLVFDVHARVFAAFGNANEYLKYFIMVVVFTLIEMPINIPFDYYGTFVIEERYGMNKTTKRTFWLDALKGAVVGIALSYLIVFIIAFFFSHYGNAAIIWTSIVVAVLVLAINMLTIPFMKIFNKFTPLEDGELKDKLQAMCDSYGIEVKRIVVMDASRRTTKANAFCTGMKKKTISLDDNLVNGFTTDEIVAVFAHEFAHARFKHILKTIPFAIASLVLTIAGIGIILNFTQLFTAFGFAGINYYFADTLLSLVIWPAGLAVSTVSNYLSRRHEYEADAFAARQGYGDALVSALKKLTKESLSKVNPHPWIVMTEYSHPTLSQRIAAIEKAKASCVR